MFCREGESVLMRKVVVIPARYGSTRFPGKALAYLEGKPLIQWVYEKALACKCADEVLIATDDRRIEAEALAFGAHVVMTAGDIASGTDRVAAALKGREAQLVVNLQGDEPFIRPDMVDMIFQTLEEGVEMATLSAPLSSDSEYRDPSTVKVVCDTKNYALYFSRAPIPFLRGEYRKKLFKHVGIYGFSRSFLERFVSLPKGLLEEAESLEQLRALENGYRIKVIETRYKGFGIDTEEDLFRAEEMIRLLDGQPERSV
jgi:3-deoxy-manno-octulosonate cytidylyltransferase (CMP-KDO synthetase)